MSMSTNIVGAIPKFNDPVCCTSVGDSLPNADDCVGRVWPADDSPAAKFPSFVWSVDASTECNCVSYDPYCCATVCSSGDE